MSAVSKISLRLDLSMWLTIPPFCCVKWHLAHYTMRLLRSSISMYTPFIQFLWEAFDRYLPIRAPLSFLYYFRVFTYFFAICVDDMSFTSELRIYYILVADCTCPNFTDGVVIGSTVNVGFLNAAYTDGLEICFIRVFI